MATLKHFPHAAFLDRLESISTPALPTDVTVLPASLAPMLLDADGKPTASVACLIRLLDAHKAVLQATFDTELVADELRRHQKFARSGPPSPHIVQLRRQQSTVRQTASQSKQSFIRIAAAFVREARLDVPQRIPLETFTIRWIDANIPQDSAAAR